MQADDYVLSPDYISRIDFLKKSCRNKSVMHLGCSSGRFIKYRLERGDHLHTILNEEADKLAGLDIDESSLEVMREMGFDNLYYGNVESIQKTTELKETFDVVVAGDLIEHITRPGAMLDGVRPLLNPGGQFIISTINAFGLHFQLKRWSGRYKEHFEHVCFYSPETLVHLFERHSYKVLEMYGAYTVPPYTWKQKLMFTVGKPLFKFAPVLAGTLVVVATPDGK